MKYLISILLAAFSIAAAAETVAMRAIAPNGAVITLTQEKGPCEGTARLATHLSPDKKMTTKGCWKTDDGVVVTIAWLDGDGSGIPAKVFKPVESI